MMKSATISFILILIMTSANSKVWTLSDANLEVHFDDQTALLSVTDKRCNKIWDQLPLKEQFTVQKTEQRGNSLKVNLSGKYQLDVNIILTESSALEISVNADEEITIQ